MPQIDFRNGKLSYSVYGKGRAIFLIHGFLGNKNLWNEYVKALQSAYRIVCIDLPGHGASDDFGYLHSMELMGEAIKAVVTDLKLRRIVLLGHSLGAYAGLAFAERYPDSVKGLILMNSTAKGDSEEKIKSRNNLLRLIKEDKEKALNLLVPNFFGLSIKNRDRKIEKYLKSALKCSDKGIAATIEGMKNRKEREIVLRFAPFPFCYFIGMHDTIISPIQQKKEAQLNEKGSVVCFEHSSHMIFMEETTDSIRQVRKWVNRLP